MLYHLLYPLHDSYSFLNVIRYTTFRSLLAFVTTMIISLFFGKTIIGYLRSIAFGQMVRDDGPKSHLVKQGTPTMGGILILFSAMISVLLWADLQNEYVWACLVCLVLYGGIGFADDYLKVSKKNTKGVSGKMKLLFQFLFGIGFGYWILTLSHSDSVYLPFFKNIHVELGWFYPFFVAFVLTGASNAVNLTDGLDGLAIGPITINALAFAVFTYVAGHQVISSYLIVPHIIGVSEVTIVACAICAAGLGFLWFNSYPAEVFMGDTGSLSLGAILGLFAVMTKNELLLVVLGGIFVLEALSVITQVYYFKATGKRIFKMAPIHHHFELKGWAEPKVIVRFWIISILLAVLSLATLKLR